jgi:hypothetical protein
MLEDAIRPADLVKKTENIYTKGYRFFIGE